MTTEQSVKLRPLSILHFSLFVIVFRRGRSILFSTESIELVPLDSLSTLRERWQRAVFSGLRSSELREPSRSGLIISRMTGHFLQSVHLLLSFVPFHSANESIGLCHCISQSPSFTNPPSVAVKYLKKPTTSHSKRTHAQPDVSQQAISRTSVLPRGPNLLWIWLYVGSQKWYRPTYSGLWEKL